MLLLAGIRGEKHRGRQVRVDDPEQGWLGCGSRLALQAVAHRLHPVEHARNPTLTVADLDQQHPQSTHQGVLQFREPSHRHESVEVDILQNVDHSVR